MINKRNNIILLLPVMLFSLCLNAQFRYIAALDSVKETGFYSIAITPELSSYLKTDLSDLRIIDEKKQQIPFILDRPYERRTHHHLLFDQKIISKITTVSNTILQIENPGKEELSNLIFELKSAAAERIASLSGSDNNKDWFVILDNVLLQKSDEYTDTSHQQRINFPASTYRYFKLTVYNNKKEQLNILKASSSMAIASIDTIQPFFENPQPKFSQIDNGIYSLVKIMSYRPYQISMIRPVITKPWLYKRQVKIFTKIKNSLAETWFSQPHHSLTITSDEFSGFGIPVIQADTLYLIIENGDNPPLRLSSISTGIINRTIIAYLEKDQSYTLLLDNPKASTPAYDLEHFKDRIPRHSSLNVKKISALPQTRPVPEQKEIYKKWIWPVIILVIALLSFMTWKLTADMKKRID